MDYIIDSEVIWDLKKNVFFHVFRCEIIFEKNTIESAST